MKHGGAHTTHSTAAPPLLFSVGGGVGVHSGIRSMRIGCITLPLYSMKLPGLLYSLCVDPKGQNAASSNGMFHLFTFLKCFNGAGRVVVEPPHYTATMSHFLSAAKKCCPSISLQPTHDEIPSEVLGRQQQHRDALLQRKRELEELERKDAESLAQRKKANNCGRTCT